MDNSDADAAEPTDEEKDQPSEESDEDNSDEADDKADPADDESPDEDEEAEDAKEQTSLKFKVPVKGEDGADTTIEVDEKELVAGYQRHSDYTRKTQELATKEREVTQVLTTKLQEGQSYYMQQAQMAHAAVRQFAGLKSPDEMAQLAHIDPAAWVQEQQRERYVAATLQQIEHGLQRETAEQENTRKQNESQAYEEAWTELKKDGIDKTALKKVFDTMRDKYQVPNERLATVMDPKLVRIMRDAAAYQELKDKKAAVTKKAQDAPKLPAQRQSVPKQVQRDQALNKRFATGKAKLSDLAAYIANS
ncbi:MULTISPECIES: hypothetical protein [unclassified Polaromonas]|uniref:hypothetical protein n=1 Tax=unclassified Polaromonas TaxID=2638319 RepID=UPI000BC8BFB4|nr:MULTISPECIES: hypothetical protein [unclassified Polaromonas]OYZ77542.1 MAG: hypothetical protein B7Y09_16350 [Polaromonas sp. 24-63-21]OZA87223.1 MAG: hypothetical protein B7X65_13640 [Polaromonas sp. 39-63-25]